MSYKEQSSRQARLFGGSAPWNEVLDAAERQPAPNGREVMFDLVREVGLNPGKVVLDVGSYGGRHAIPLAQEFDCHSIALDLVLPGLQSAPDAIQAAGVSDCVSLLQADAHEMPLRNGCIDMIVSNDMLSCVEPPRFLAECARVLSPAGNMVLHAVYFTALMEVNERARLTAAFALTDGTDRERTEEAIHKAGLDVVQVHDFGFQSLEANLIKGDQRLAEDHLTAMRLRRGEPELIGRFGQDWYNTILASYEWMPLMALGKLENTFYVLRHHSTPMG
ncbi:MAG: class I SAM-dependent methyltransferase [Actinomycetota bacterium]